MNCFDYFLRLLSRREYSAKELLKKGKEKGFSESVIADTISILQEKDYQSDTRLAAQIIASSQGKYGQSMVKRKCLEKGISADVFEQAWMKQQETDESEVTGELDNLKAKVMRKYKLEDFQKIEPKVKVKLFNYLSYRGFNAFEVLEQWRREEEVSN